MDPLREEALEEPFGLVKGAGWYIHKSGLLRRAHLPHVGSAGDTSAIFRVINKWIDKTYCGRSVAYPSCMVRKTVICHCAYRMA